MPRRLLKLVSKSLSRAPGSHAPTHAFTTEDIVWTMGSFCALNRKPFDAGLLLKQFPPPYTSDSFIHAARALGFKIKRRDCNSADLASLSFPCLVVLSQDGLINPAGNDTPNSVRPEPVEGQELSPHVVRQAHHERAYEQTESASAPRVRPAIVVKHEQDNITLFEGGSNQPKVMSQAEFAARFAGIAFQLALETKSIKDPDGATVEVTSLKGMVKKPAAAVSVATMNRAIAKRGSAK